MSVQFHPVLNPQASACVRCHEQLNNGDPVVGHDDDLDQIHEKCLRAALSSINVTPLCACQRQIDVEGIFTFKEKVINILRSLGYNASVGAIGGSLVIAGAVSPAVGVMIPDKVLPALAGALLGSYVSLDRSNRVSSIVNLVIVACAVHSLVLKLVSDDPSTLSISSGWALAGVSALTNRLSLPFIQASIGQLQQRLLQADAPHGETALFILHWSLIRLCSQGLQACAQSSSLYASAARVYLLEATMALITCFTENLGPNLAPGISIGTLMALLGSTSTDIVKAILVASSLSGLVGAIYRNYP